MEVFPARRVRRATPGNLLGIIARTEEAPANADTLLEGSKQKALEM